MHTLSLHSLSYNTNRSVIYIVVTLYHLGNNKEKINYRFSTDTFQVFCNHIAEFKDREYEDAEGQLYTVQHKEHRSRADNNQKWLGLVNFDS